MKQPLLKNPSSMPIPYSQPSPHLHSSTVFTSSHLVKVEDTVKTTTYLWMQLPLDTSQSASNVRHGLWRGLENSGEAFTTLATPNLPQVLRSTLLTMNSPPIPWVSLNHTFWESLGHLVEVSRDIQSSASPSTFTQQPLNSSLVPAVMV
jgi:hypothetical protein